MSGKSFFDPIFSSPSSSNTAEQPNILPENENDSFSDLESGFDFAIDFSPNEIRASTPKLENSIGPNSSPLLPRIPCEQISKDNVVLRIDNVPWAGFLMIDLFYFYTYVLLQDITPSQVITWLQQPVELVHVLLDCKGKTLSHAYIEIKNQQIAGAILRGEAVGPGGRKKERGSVLGRGRRARGVTITRSSQEELMAEVSCFPDRSQQSSLNSLLAISSLEGYFRRVSTFAR